MEAAAIADQIVKDAVVCMLSGEITVDDRNGLTQYIVDRLSAEYPQTALPPGIDPFSLLVGVILGRSIATYSYALNEA